MAYTKYCWVFHVSGFKLEDTDKRKIDEYLKTLNNGNILYSNDLVKHYYVKVLLSTKVCQLDVLRVFKLFVVFFVIYRELPANYVIESKKLLRNIIWISDS